jgi:hypothetical protein
MSSIENNSKIASSVDSSAGGSVYSDTSSTENISLGSVERDGFPPAAFKTQPWKALGLPQPEEEGYQPASWNLLGRAWNNVLVTVDMILDLGSSAT